MASAMSVTIVSRGFWALPLILNGDSEFAPNSIPYTPIADVPITTTDRPLQTITLYRGVSKNAGIAYEEALLGIATVNGFKLSFG